MKRKYKKDIWIEPVEYLMQIRDFQNERGEIHKAQVNDLKISRKERAELKRQGITVKRKLFTHDWLMEW